MRYVSATETQNKFAAIMDIARREPVTIQKNGRDTVVMMAIEDYEKLTKHMINSFQEFCDNVGNEASQKGLDENKLNELFSDD
jgi:prevent-host-death family protein